MRTDMMVKIYFKNFLHLIVVILTSCLFFGCVANILIKPGPTNNINPADWEKIKIGMSKEQVKKNLSCCPCQKKISVGDSGKSTLDFWEYDYCSSPLSGPSPKAYVVFFNEEGLVYDLRAPIDN